MNEWINVKDKVPPVNEIVFVFNGWAAMQGSLLIQEDGERYYSIQIFKFSSKNKNKFGYYKEKYEEITHWMPFRRPALEFQKEKANDKSKDLMDKIKSGTYEVKINFLGDLPEKLNLPREKVAEILADKLMKIIERF